MAYELSWRFDANRAYLPTSAADLTQYQMWYLVTFLMCGPGMASYQNGAGGCWTYQGSCDSLTADMSANIANFKWGTIGTYDPSKIVQVTAAPATTPHSWVVLRSPQRPDGGYTYLLIEAYFTATTGYGISHSNNAWSLAATPTWTPTSTNTTPSPPASGAIQTNDGIAAARWFDGCLAANGNFIIFDAKQGSGFSQHAIQWHNCYQYQNTDQYPYFVFHFYNTGTPGAWWATALTSSTVGILTARNFQGSMGANANYMPLSPGGWSTRDIGNARGYRMPFWVWCSISATAVHARGRLQDVAFIIVNNSSVAPFKDGYAWVEGGVVKYVSLGCWVIPFNTLLQL